VLRHGTQIRRLKRVLHHRGAHIELALDEGDVVAGDARAPLAELEFELLSGPLPALLDLAARWAQRFGLRPDPATKSERAQWLLQGLPMRPVARGETPQPAADLPLGTAGATLVAAALAHALPNAAAITEGRHGPDHLHQLRVGLRRLRSVLRAFGPADPRRDAALATLFAALGSRRDADVLAATLAPAAAAAGAAGLIWPVVEPVGAAGADDALIDAASSPERALSAPGTTRLWLLLLALAVPGPDPTPWGPTALAVLRRWHRRARRAAAAWATLDEARRHALRRRLKRVRYLMEFSAALLPAKAAKAEAVALRRLQDSLGRWNDLLAARDALAALPATPGRDAAARGRGVQAGGAAGSASKAALTVGTIWSAPSTASKPLRRTRDRGCSLTCASTSAMPRFFRLRCNCSSASRPEVSSSTRRCISSTTARVPSASVAAATRSCPPRRRTASHKARRRPPLAAAGPW
jgi:triphosphatase